MVEGFLAFLDGYSKRESQCLIGIQIIDRQMNVFDRQIPICAGQMLILYGQFQFCTDKFWRDG